MKIKENSRLKQPVSRIIDENIKLKDEPIFIRNHSDLHSPKLVLFLHHLKELTKEVMHRRSFIKRSLGFITLGGISLSVLATTSNDKVKKYMVIAGRCEGCGRCLKACHEHALSAAKNGKAVIDPKKCKGCGDCTRYCKNMAIVEKYR